MRNYGPAHPEFEPWLVNFVTQEEEEVAGPAIRACMADPATMSDGAMMADPAIARKSCHRMHVVVDDPNVLRVTVWPAGSVEPVDVLM